MLNVNIPIIKNKYVHILAILAPIIFLKAVIILSHPTCIGSDCSTYIRILEHPEEWQERHGLIEPLFLVIAKPLMLLFSPGDTIKIIQLGSHTNLVIGTFILMRRHYGMNAAVIGVILVSSVSSMNTYIIELVRNMISLSIFPYVLYFISGNKNETPRQYACILIISALMLLAHRSSIVLITAIGIYMIWQHRQMRSYILITMTLLAIAIGYCFMIQNTSSAAGSPTPEHNLILLLLPYLWVLVPIFKTRLHHHWMVKILLLSVIPSLVIFPFVGFSMAQRLIMETYLPFTYILVIFMSTLFEGRVSSSIRPSHLRIIAITLLFVLLIIDTPISLTFLITRYGK